MLILCNAGAILALLLSGFWCIHCY